MSPVELADGAMTFDQARMTLDCRKLFKISMTADSFVDKEILAKWYNANPGGGLHDVYVVEIEAVYEK